jgi:hypothetical protein
MIFLDGYRKGFDGKKDPGCRRDDASGDIAPICPV